MHTLSYFFRILRTAIAFMEAYFTKVWPSWIIAMESLAKLYFTRRTYLRSPEAKCSCSNCWARVLKHPTTSASSSLSSPKNFPPHPTHPLYQWETLWCVHISIIDILGETNLVTGDQNCHRYMFLPFALVLCTIEKRVLPGCDDAEV